LLNEVRRIQGSEGADIGLPKLYKHIKEEHSGTLVSSVYAIQKAHKLAPPPPSFMPELVPVESPSMQANERSQRSVTSGLEMLTMHFYFNINYDPKYHCEKSQPCTA